MKISRILFSFFFLFAGVITVFTQSITLSSPDNKIVLSINNGEKLNYAIQFNEVAILNSSSTGFEFMHEDNLDGNFSIETQTTKTVDEKWIPVVKLKHAEVIDHYKEIHLNLREKSGAMRQMDLTFRVYNDGVAFRYKLYRSENIGARAIANELTSFSIPGDPKAWIVNYGSYTTSQEREFDETTVSSLTEKSIAGLPILMEYDNNCWVAITEANIDNYSAFYVGRKEASNELITKLAPLPGETEDGVKGRFNDEVYSPWRVILVGETPGVLIESEIIRNLNEPCAIEDPSWIKPGISAWDHWWSGDVKMEMPVIKEYIDLAAEMGWEYMLVDWQWYGEFNKPEADITTWAPQIDIQEVIAYAKERDVRIILWMYSKDVNRNSAYKKAFPLYREWGAAGVKIDFMDRDDQDMVNWYRDIIKCAAENQLLVDFHGAYKSDGIIRTYPNMITREGVMGNEYYKFSDDMNPEHNVKLAFTRMLGGPMDYTPGGFLNVTREDFKQQVPALVWNTRACELAKFVVYESPLTVVCDHPDNIRNQPGADFLKIVPTTWDDTKFLGGYPGDYVAIARRNGNTWYIGVMNNSKGKAIELNLDFLPEGEFELNSWADAVNANAKPTNIKQKTQSVNREDSLEIKMADNGGFAATITLKQE